MWDARDPKISDLSARHSKISARHSKISDLSKTTNLGGEPAGITPLDARYSQKPIDETIEINDSKEDLRP